MAVDSLLNLVVSLGEFRACMTPGEPGKIVLRELNKTRQLLGLKRDDGMERMVQQRLPPQKQG